MVKKFRLPRKSWEEKLKKINKKIKEWNIDEEIEWIMSINDQTIESNDAYGLQRALSTMSPPLNIKIMDV